MQFCVFSRTDGVMTAASIRSVSVSIFLCACATPSPEQPKLSAFPADDPSTAAVEPVEPQQEELVARVNGVGVTRSEFDDILERNMARYRGQGHTLPAGIELRIKESVLRRMIDDEIIEQKAEEIGIAITDEEIDAKYAEHKARFRTNRDFEDYLRRSSNTEANMRSHLRRKIVRDRVVEQLSGAVEVTEEELAAYYEENKQRFVEKEQVKASRILIRAARGANNETRARAKAKTREIRNRVSVANFGDVAREESDGPEAQRGGELGWLTRGRMAQAFDQVAFELPLGQVSRVVDTRMGFEIILVHDKRPENARSFEEVSENIRASLMARKRNERRRDVLRGLKQQATIEQLISFDPPGQAQRGDILGSLGPLILREGRL